jgi:hypothetical protein
MEAFELYQFLKKNKFQKIPSKKWPSKIYLAPRFWDSIIALNGLTRSENTEYALSVLDIEGKMYTSRPMSGEAQSIQISHQYGKKYRQEKNGNIYQEIMLDGEKVDEYKISRSQANNILKGGVLFNLHTHPQHIDFRGNPTYSFFSVQDFLSFIGSTKTLMGLVTDKFWLVGKTDKTIKTVGEVGIEMLNRVSHQAFVDSSQMDLVVQKEMKNWGMVFYRGEFNRSLERLI